MLSGLNITAAAHSLAVAWGSPMSDGIPDFRKSAYSAPIQAELEGDLSVTITPGTETMYSHPDIQGVAFSRAHIERAVIMAEVADRNVSIQDRSPGADFIGVADGLEPGLIRNPDFIGACRRRDRKEQMRLVLEAIAQDGECKSPSSSSGTYLSSGDTRTNPDASFDDHDSAFQTDDSLSLEPDSDDGTTAGQRISHVEDRAGTRVVSKEEILEQMPSHCVKIICRVMGSDKFDMDALEGFLGMDAGLRELRLRQHAASAWSGQFWKSELEEMSAASKFVYTACHIAPPQREEFERAVRDPANLTEDQRDIVERFFQIGRGKITAFHIEGFGVWVRNQSKELRDFWEANYPSDSGLENLHNKMRAKAPDWQEGETNLLARILHKAPESINQHDKTRIREVECFINYQENFSRQWFFASPEERRAQWRRGMVDLMTAADIAHKFRYMDKPAMSADEADMLEVIFPTKGIKSFEEISGPLGEDFLHALVFHVDDAGKYDNALMSIASLGNQVQPASLLLAAQRDAEYSILLDAFGAENPHPVGIIETSACISRSKLEQGKPASSNDDSVSSVKIAVPGKGMIILDAVWDGMGGHHTGETGGLKNGQRASNIAKDVFEISAVSGWITSPEDVRKADVLADLAIVMEQISLKENPDEMRENNMGTTASVFFQHGAESYGIHCGDSRWRIIRGQDTIFESDEHTSTYLAREKARKTVARIWGSTGTDLAELNEGQQIDFEMQVRAQTKPEILSLAALYPGGLPPPNVVCSVLGARPMLIHINNVEQGPRPMILHTGDLLAVSSDGIISVCDHEIAILAEQAGNRLDIVRDQVINLAEQREGKGPHSTICKCKTREGKQNDDKSLVLRRADDGFNL